MIEKGKYQEALDILNQGLSKAPLDIRLNFFKARVFAFAEPPLYNVDSSYFYFVKCQDLFGILRDIKIRDELNKIPINVAVVKNQINSLLNREYQAIQGTNTIEAYASFIERFPDSKYARDAQTKHDELVFKQFSATPRTLAEYKALHLANPNASTRLMVADQIAKLIRKSPTIEDCEFYVTQFTDHEQWLEFCYILYEMMRKDGELKTLLRFYKDVPALPLNEKQRADYENAKFAWNLGLTASNGSSGGCFGQPTRQTDENQELNRRLTREGAKTGDLQFSLMWNNLNDIDLHVIDPLGEIIYFGNRMSASGGNLDVDMNVMYKAGRYSEQPVENIFWPTGAAPSGHYTVIVVHYLNHQKSGCKDPTDFVVRVRCNGQDTLLKGSLTYNEDKPRKKMIEFDYAMPERNYPTMDDSLVRQYDMYIKSAAPVELALVAVQKMMMGAIETKNWEVAIRTLANYSKYFVKDNDVMARIRELDGLLRDDRFQVTKERLAKVNTGGEEYSPVLSADEKLLYFCGRSRNDNIGKEDIFVARASSDGKWEAASPFAFINTREENEAPLSVSADGNTILLFRNGDIYYASKTSSGWSAPTAFPAPVNSGYWEGDAMLTSDGKAILFASNRPGGQNLFTDQNFFHGNSNYASDLYVCVKSNNTWGPAINLGKQVNTPYCERSPYLHPDMHTMYFSSDAFYGLGDLDVFMIKRTSDTSWTQWSAPINLGRNINTTQPDWGYQISASGQWAYFAASTSTSDTREDIYRFSLPEELRPDPVVALTGRLTNMSDRSVSATIHWIDLSTGNEVGISQSDPQTGQYYILLTAGSHYGYYAESGEYFSVSDHLNLEDADRYNVVNQDIRLYEMEQLVADGTALRINNLFFDYDRSTLRPESFPELNRLAEIIIKYPDIKVEIMGHTDNMGPDDYNLKLSQSRAETVRDYLISKGVPANRLVAKGYGKDRPLVENTNDKNRQMNRRVEFRFYR
jgi:outer membrane protein OmpA-like peptidoglycan-associated protein